MVRAGWRCLPLLLLWAACGNRAPEPRAAPTAVADAGVVADAGAPDAGALAVSPADAGAPLADAGLAELGVAPCQAVVMRFMACPGVPEDSKKQLASVSRRWYQEAQKSQESREKLAAGCLEMARMTEQMLLDLGC